MGKKRLFSRTIFLFDKHGLLTTLSHRNQAFKGFQITAEKEGFNTLSEQGKTCGKVKGSCVDLYKN